MNTGLSEMPKIDVVENRSAVKIADSAKVITSGILAEFVLLKNDWNHTYLRHDFNRFDTNTGKYLIVPRLFPNTAVKSYLKWFIYYPFIS